jgi:hypothetical protein
MFSTYVKVNVRTNKNTVPSVNSQNHSIICTPSISQISPYIAREFQDMNPSFSNDRDNYFGGQNITI